METSTHATSFAWVFALMGITSILFGAAALAWPGLTLGALLVVFAAYAAAGGVLAIVNAFEAAGQHRSWWPSALIGVVNLLASVGILAYPGMTAITLVFLVGFWWIFGGMLELVAAFGTGRFLWLLAGLLSVVAGFVLLGNPRDGALALVMVIGIYSIARGIVLLVEAFQRPQGVKLEIF
jgi:uncharacterized membrane protein HdeD (DUF308 family)